MTWILWSITGAAIIHILEEYWWPGGFLATMRTAAPRFAPFITPAAAIVINGIMFLGLTTCALVGAAVPFLSLSGAALVFVNGCVHLGAALQDGRYVPGLVSGVLLYVPLSLTAYVLFAGSGYLSAETVGASAGLGILYQSLPLAYFSLRVICANPKISNPI